jgi:hypothetical protein
MNSGPLVVYSSNMSAKQNTAPSPRSTSVAEAGDGEEIGFLLLPGRVICGS